MLSLLFSFASFVFSSNYCVEKTNGNCKKICQNAPLNFDKTFNHIPSNEEVDENTAHNLFIADDVDYSDWKHNIILCNPSIKLIYPIEVSKLVINDDIKADWYYLNPKVPILFLFNSTLTIEIEADETSTLPLIILEATKPNLLIKPMFLTEKLKPNMFSISDKSENINVYEITKDIETVFSNTDKLINNLDTYYCLSDHEEKCKDYSSYNLTYIKSTAEVIKHPCYLIVETSKRQLYISDHKLRYTHIVCLEGSDLTYRSASGNGFYIIVHSKYIELAGMYFEGKGSFTVLGSFYFKLFSTTEVNNFDFTLKSPSPFETVKSEIDSLRSFHDLFTINPKIKIDEITIFNGPKNFAGLFEPDKYLITNTEFKTSLKSPDEYQKYYYNDVRYHLSDGVYEIPDTWGKKCSIGSYANQKYLSLIFNNVYTYDGYSVNSIYVNNFNSIIIRPAKHLSLVEQPASYYSNFTIEVYDEVIVHKIKKSADKKGKCEIVGNGTLKFIDSYHEKNITEYCTVSESIKREIVNSPYPDVYICVGQSSLEKCKSEIDNIGSINNVEWIWLKDINTIEKIDYYKKIFVTDEQYLTYYKKQEMTLTAKASLTIETHELIVNKNKVNGIIAQKKSAKLRVFFIVESSFYDIDYYKKAILKIQYNEDPTEIDLSIYLHYENIQLSMNYLETFQANTIKLCGKSVVNIRDPFKEIIKIFNVSNSTLIQVNPEPDYEQICYSDDVKQCEQFADFVLAPNISEFTKYDTISTKSKVSLYKDITLSLNSNYYVSSTFKCCNAITITCDLPENAIIQMNSNCLYIISDRSYYFDLNSKTENIKFIFNVNNKVTIDNQYVYSVPSIELRSSQKSFEVIPSRSLKNTLKPFISVSNDISIYSPLLNYAKCAFNSVNILQSKSWTYLYLSEDAKSLCEDFNCLPFSDFQDDENLTENLVLAVGYNDVLKIPKNWVKKHNVYLLQNGNELTINDAIVISYLPDGIILNDNFKIISGNIKIIAPQDLSINANMSIGCEVFYYLYKAKIDITQNSLTNIHTGLLISNRPPTQIYSHYKVIDFYGLSTTNQLSIILKDQSDLYEFNVLNNYQIESNSNVNLDFGYDYICYCSVKDIEYYCSGKYYHSSDITSFLASVKENPGKIANLNKDLIIPFPTGNHYILNPSNDKIRIELPDQPLSISILENDQIQIKYEDSTLIDILSKAIIKVGLKESIIFDIESSTKSSLILSLESDVFISPESKFSADFNFELINNSFTFLAYDVNEYKNIFGQYIKEFVRVCAYQDNSDSCSFKYKRTFDDTFKDPVDFQEVEIAPLSKSEEIALPYISKLINVNILPKSNSILTINDVKSLQINSESIIVNEFWHFTGDRTILSFRLNKDSSLSISEQNNIPINLQLTNNQSLIDMKKCVPQKSKQISILKYGQTNNELTIYGSSEIYKNFKNYLIDHDGIRLISNSSQKYFCICKNTESCDKCKENTEGFVVEADKITSDPGENVDIKILSDLETSSKLFTNKHNVYVDMNCKLNITDVQHVDQNINDKIIVDKLVFHNASNLLLKPREPIFDITMQKILSGLSFTIEMDTFLKLNVVNSNEKDINASELYVKGYGELNIYDYPFNKIIANESISIIKGVYTICNSKAENSYCSYDSAGGYKLLENRYDFIEEFDPYSKIVVFLDSFTHSFDVNIKYLSGQKIQFMRNPNSAGLLEKQNKIRFLQTTELISKQDSSLEIAGSKGGVRLETSDSDLFVIGLEESLTIKQEGNVTSNSNTITIQPLNEKGSIIFDDSFDIGKQKIKIDLEGENNISLIIVVNESASNKEEISDSIEFDSNKVSVNIIDKEQYDKEINTDNSNSITKDDIISTNNDNERNDNENIKPRSQKKKLSKGGIAGIVIAVLAVVGAAAAFLTIFLLKKKESIDNDLCDISNESTDKNQKSDEP